MINKGIEKVKRKLKRNIETIRKPSQSRSYNKVFCVGWLKTGTTSTRRALEKIGFKHCGWDPKLWREYYQNRKIEKIIKHGRYFESFDDLPWCKYEMLDTLNLSFPNSKFILLNRKMKEWKQSIASFRRRNGEEYDLKEEVEYYKRHKDYVREYFLGKGNGREEQLLVMNVCDGDGYEKLCPFLNVENINESFPHISP